MDNDIIAAAAAETAADAVALSTYNGAALRVAEDLVERLGKRDLQAAVFVGGRLTQDLGPSKSVDVSGHISALGAWPCDSVPQMVNQLRELASSQA